MFYQWERYDSRNIEDSMDDVFVWKLISKVIWRLDTRYEGAKKNIDRNRRRDTIES